MASVWPACVWRRSGGCPSPHRLDGRAPQAHNLAARDTLVSHRASLLADLLEVQRIALGILGINQDRNQAPFRKLRAGVGDPGPKCMCSSYTRIRPFCIDIIVLS
jgi:hypothetical protein